MGAIKEQMIREQDDLEFLNKRVGKLERALMDAREVIAILRGSGGAGGTERVQELNKTIDKLLKEAGRCPCGAPLHDPSQRHLVGHLFRQPEDAS